MKNLARADAAGSVVAHDRLVTDLGRRVCGRVNMRGGAGETEREENNSENGFDGGGEGVSVFHFWMFNFGAKSAVEFPKPQSCFSPCLNVPFP